MKLNTGWVGLGFYMPMGFKSPKYAENLSIMNYGTSLLWMVLRSVLEEQTNLVYAEICSF